MSFHALLLEISFNWQYQGLNLQPFIWKHKHYFWTTAVAQPHISSLSADKFDHKPDSTLTDTWCNKKGYICEDSIHVGANPHCTKHPWMLVCQHWGCLWKLPSICWSCKCSHCLNLHSVASEVPGTRNQTEQIKFQNMFKVYIKKHWVDAQ